MPGGQPATDQVAFQSAMLDALGDALSIAFFVYDTKDQILFASRQVSSFFNIPQRLNVPAMRLRDFLGAAYDCNPELAAAHRGNGANAREEWIAAQVSVHWRERSDTVYRAASGRLLNISRRRMPSGYGLCVVTDISEKRKREDQWRADMERVQLTEEILDNLAVPLFVCDARLNLVAVNKAFSAVTGRSPDSLIDQPMGAVVAGDIGLRLVAAAQHVLESGFPTKIAATADSCAVEMQRIGKPGRYFLVGTTETPATMQEPHKDPARDRAAEDAAIACAAASSDALSGASTAGARPLDGTKVLLVTEDREFEAQGLTILAGLGIDACAVRNLTEEQAFLSIAESVGVTLDLVVVDSQLEMRCLEIAEQKGLSTLALDAFDLPCQLAQQVMAAIGHGVKPGTADDWEIATPDGPRSKPSDRPVQILVAEDNAVNQIVFSQILEGLGYSYRIVADGAAAIAAVAPPATRPALIFMDLTLPDISGAEAAARIRATLGADFSRLPLIGVLSHAVEGDQDACLAAGMRETIMKPLSPDMIEHVLKRYEIEPSRASLI